jgi:hypothetical protein
VSLPKPIGIFGVLRFHGATGSGCVQADENSSAGRRFDVSTNSATLRGVFTILSTSLNTLNQAGAKSKFKSVKAHCFTFHFLVSYRDTRLAIGLAL